jgi:hypothetical protein
VDPEAGSGLTLLGIAQPRLIDTRPAELPESMERASSPRTAGRT